MLDWSKTPIDALETYRPRIAVICDGCGKSSSIILRVKSKITGGTFPWQCPSCIGKRPEVRNKLSKSAIRAWSDAAYHQQHINQSRQLWSNSEFRLNHKNKRKSPKKTKTISKSIKQKWEDPEYSNKILSIQQTNEYKAKIAEANKRKWADPVVRERLLSSLRSSKCREQKARRRAAQSGKISNIQKILYSLLDDLGVHYYGDGSIECAIGPYVFDCLIPREGKTSLLIECQGEYWHTLPGRRNRDEAKATYINNNLSHLYEVKYIWEHEFLNKDRVYGLLQYWLGITKQKCVSFSFDNVEIRKCEAPEYRPLLEKYHYLATAGRGGVAYGAFLSNELIAICVFSPPARQNLNYSSHARELSRLCIHPKYQKKNFASWFISRSVSLLPTKFSKIISYCDTTFNHDGAVYKASNFKLDGEVKPDY
jgi:hypothetical protein